MRVSINFINLIEGFEGFRSCPYLDSGKLPTIGIGSIRDLDNHPVTMETLCITHGQAISLLLRDISTVQDMINKYVISKINQNQYDSIASLAYNIGDGGFEKSTLLKIINGDANDPAIKDHWLEWDRVHGNYDQGLENRREKEYNLYITPVSV